MNKAQYISRLVCLCGAALGALLHAQNSVHPLAAPYAATTYSNTPPVGATDPWFNNGYIIQFRHQTQVAGQSNVYLYNSDGYLEHQLAISPKGATKLFLTSVDVSKNGHLAVAGWDKTEDGRYTAFITLSDLDGGNAQYIDTGTYLPNKLAIRPDGSVWSVGSEKAEETAGILRWKNYNALRHYDAAGKLLEQFLPRWGAQVAYAEERSNQTGKHDFFYDLYGHPVDEDKAEAAESVPGDSGKWNTSLQTYIRTSSAATILYDGISKRVCIYKDSGKILSCSGVGGAMLNMLVTGFAVTDRGDILASMKSSVPGKGSSQKLYALIQPPTNSDYRWAEVPGTSDSSDSRGEFLSLLGADSNSLVYRRYDTPNTPTTVYKSYW